MSVIKRKKIPKNLYEKIKLTLALIQQKNLLPYINRIKLIFKIESYQNKYNYVCFVATVESFALF
jgi:hypothetical protein